MERRLWYIKHAEFFSWLADEEQQRLARRTKLVSCRRNCQLFFHDDPSDNIYLVKEGKTAFSRTEAKVTYHDPCYLGRHNGEFDAPRTVLRAIPGVRLKEMAKITKNALCCGGGGGNFFTDIIGSGENSPSRIRIREAAETGAEILAVACPTCAKMFEDAVKDEALEGTIEVKDIAEIALA